MLNRTSSIVLSIIIIVFLVGFISGVAPGLLVDTYPLFGIAAGIVFLILIILLIIGGLYQDQNGSVMFLIGTDFLLDKLSKKHKTLIIFVNGFLFSGGFLVGIIIELLFKAIGAAWSVQLIVGGIDLFFILVCCLIILFIGLNDSTRATPVRVSRPVQSTFIKSARKKPEHSPLPTLHQEYQRLLYPSARYSANEKVFINENDLGQVIDADGLGNYRVKHMKTGQIETIKGSALRKALPLIS